MLTADQIKELILKLGADLCGIAPVDRFSAAPKGFHPKDIYQECQSVIVFAKRLPVSCLDAENCVPYTYVNNILTQQVDLLGVEIALQLEKEGIQGVPIPSDDPYEFWDEERSYGRAILSMRHAGYLAGLGTLGKNTLLITKEFGNMVQIGAVLVNISLLGDPIVQDEICPPNCRLCLENCPQRALDGVTVDQSQCRPLSNFQTDKGYILKKCNLCRKICPYHQGVKSRS